MNRVAPVSRLAVVAAAGLAVAAIAQGPAALAPAAPSGEMADGNARAEAVLTSTCTACHDLGVLVSRPRAAEEWPEILRRMIGNGANLSENDFKLLSDYLARAYSAPVK